MSWYLCNGLISKNYVDSSKLSDFERTLVFLDTLGTP
uniref:Uncharacterized protein n=1 Tax=Anguilla anguilla TaxID=7936 RepID=A0A0E9VWM0_ANGAN